MNVTIYADGSVKGNNAGWGFVLYSENVKLLGCGRLRDSNINRVELIAVLQGLQRTAPGRSLHRFTLRALRSKALAQISRRALGKISYSL